MNLLMWKNGCIMHPAKLWKYKTARRVPSLFVWHRSKTVVIEIRIEGDFVVFKETDTFTSEALKRTDKKELEFYKKRYLLPEKIGNNNILEYLVLKPLYIFSDPTYERIFFVTKLPIAKL
ncbi:MAG: hypothetical protein ABIJ38_01125 [Patescibacteria group bacterium]